MPTDVLADPLTLLKQAPATIDIYFREVVEMLDSVFGDDYAKQHPALVGSLVASCAQDFHTANMRIAAADIRDAIQSVSISRD